jgi:hypothetical protein
MLVLPSFGCGMFNALKMHRKQKALNKGNTEKVPSTVNDFSVMKSDGTD